jgi:hypothetical protein
VDGKTEMNQLIDHPLDLIFTGRILHCDDHECARFACRDGNPRFSGQSCFHRLRKEPASHSVANRDLYRQN